MWCLWQSLPCSIQCLSLAITLCFAESDLVAFAPPLGMACVWTWLWQATLPLCRDCLLRRRCGRQAGQCDTPPAFIRRWMVHIVGGYRGGSYGFPSCHAANSFALASFLTLLFANRKLSLFIFAWAVLNSYSRVYLGVHYPGDLLVGAIIGTAAGLAMAFAAGYVADRVDRPHLKPSVNTGVVTSVGAFTVAVIAVVSCFVRM